MRGDIRSLRIKTLVYEILPLIEQTPDTSLTQTFAHLHERHGFKLAQSMTCRLPDRRSMTFNESQARQPVVVRLRHSLHYTKALRTAAITRPWVSASR